MEDKQPYNWRTDPKNAEEVARLSWWDRPENKKFFRLPYSLVKDGKYWIAATNNETKSLLGEELHGCGQGKTKKEAIRKMFLIIKVTHEFSQEEVRDFQRWVPFRKGDWKQIGGTWFVVFGIHFYFRYGSDMQGGWYIPKTKLNISINSDWKNYRNWKNEKKKQINNEKIS